MEQASRPQALYPSAAELLGSAWQMNHDGKKETHNSSHFSATSPFLVEQPLWFLTIRPTRGLLFSFIHHPRALATSLALLEVQWTVLDF